MEERTDDTAMVVPADQTRDRDVHGLLSVQRKYFEVLAVIGGKQLTCAAISIPVRQISRWLREDPAFLKAHEEFFSASRAATKARFDELQERLPDLATELMEAHKIVTVEHVCTHCGERDKVSVDTTNDVVRARMWADLMKATGHLTDIRRVEGEVSVTLLTAGQRIAIEKLRRGLPVSVQQRKELEEMGLLEGLTQYDGSGLLGEGEIVD